jgi:hypothetical protein
MDKSVFKRIMDNLAFAMELNDQIPEHIRQEIAREESLEKRSNESIEEFNAIVSRKLPKQGHNSQKKNKSKVFIPLANNSGSHNLFCYTSFTNLTNPSAKCSLVFHSIKVKVCFSHYITS